ncbi:hypothetical protein DFH06DRAFT_1163848 [Mycena polygramma]|nr:hypothetical protein DFH06DRAFT_1163848 [Mycena polygramma]
MASSSTSQIASTGESIIYDIVGLAVQTLFFGVYTVLTVLSTRMLLKRGLKTRANHVMFILTIFTYSLSTAYWAYSVTDCVDRMKDYIQVAENLEELSNEHDTVTKYSPLFNALVLVNYVFSDGVVVWRAWIISFRNYRKYLYVTIVFWVLTAVTVTSTIVFRIIALIQSPYAQLPDSSYLAKGINILQMCNLVFSLISNLSATAVVGTTAWHHRQSIRAAFADNKKSTKADRILVLVVESGLLYCVSGLTVLVASLIRLPHGTLGDIYTPINVQIAGAYPPVVLLLVSMQRSLNETTFLGTFEGSTPSRPIQFGGSAPSGDQNRAHVLSIQFASNPELSRTRRGSEGEILLGSDTVESMSVAETPREKVGE